METDLSRSTDLRPLQRKTLIYSTIATHALRKLKTSPIVVLDGPTNTGKSDALDSVYQFSRQPKRESLKGLSDASLREIFEETFEATAVLEEADCGSKSESNSFEGIVKNRSSRRTSQSRVKTPDNKGRWISRPVDTFGATFLHRQKPFQDPSLDTRIIEIDTHPNGNKLYGAITEREPINEIAIVLDMELDFGLPRRIADTYHCCIAVAVLVADIEYVQELTSDLSERAVQRLKELQDAEPTNLVLAAVMHHSIGENGDFTPRTKYSTMAEWIMHEYAVSLAPRQVGTLLRMLKIETTVSNGVTVAVPNPLSLLSACEKYNYVDDDAIVKLRKLCSKSLSRKSTKSTVKPHASLWIDDEP